MADALSQEALAELGKQYLYPNYRQPPLVLTRGQGSVLWDVGGKRYLDFFAGIAVSALGHGHPALARALAEQAARLVHVSNYFYNEPNVRLAERLCKVTQMDRAFFCNSGTEAIEACLKLARRHFRAAGQPERLRVVAFDNSFHGRTLGALAATGQGKYKEGFGQLPHTTHVPYGDTAAVRAAMASDVAAILVEPVQGEGGVLPAPAGFLRELRRIADEHGSLLIVDEIQTGVGRTGAFLAIEHENVRADVIALAKGLGAGVPIGAMLCRESLSQALPPGSHGSTFGGNALASAAALCVLETLESERLIEKAALKGDRLATGLRRAADRHPKLVDAVRGRGLLQAIVLSESVDARALLGNLQKDGLMVTIAGGQALRFSPPLVVTDAEIDEGIEILERGLKTYAREPSQEGMRVTSARLSAESGRVKCARCGTPVDPLRADRVAIYGDSSEAVKRGERFRYFCSLGCYEAYDPRATTTPLPLPLPRERDSVSPELPRTTPLESPRLGEQATLRELGLVGRNDEELPRSASSEGATPGELTHGEASLAAPLGDEPQALAVGALLLTLAATGGTLAIALALAGSSPVAITARLVLSAVALCALAAESWMGERDATELSPPALLAAPVGGVVIALSAYITSSHIASSAVTLSALVVAFTAIGVLLVRRARRPSDVERQQILLELDGLCRRVVGDDVVETRSVDLRPGEEIVLESGDVVPVDATVSAGTATVQPWRSATTREERREGEVVVAGARLIEGRLRAVVSWAGPDRAWVRLSSDPHRRADLYSSLGRAGRIFAERLAPFLTGAAALAAFAGNLDWVEVGVLAVAVHAALTSPVLATVPALHVARAILSGLRRGVAFRAAEAFDRAGKVSTLAFCARGTLLLGEPEVADIEAFGEHRASDVLALVAGAESGSQRATATAIQRAARARGVRPDGVRSPNPQPGLGTTAVASNGQALVVGSRALMLREHVSVAAVEARLTELEAMGRSVLLVALGGRLIGLLGLQDGLRPGARAAVQHLLDIGIEPVLLSGDARETCEALGHALDIDHIRPELPPAERSDAIHRLRDGGAVVAVLGRSPVDDLALSAGDVSIALSTAGSTSSEWNVQLASDDVRDAAFALRLAHDARREARLALLVALAPAALGGVAATLGLTLPALAPLGAALGGGLALIRLRTTSS